MTENVTTISAGQADQVTRGLAVTEHGDTATVVATISQAYATTVEDLWNACTSAERLPRWFGPVSGDLEVGGRYRIEGNADGTIEACEPPSRVKVTWEFAGNTSWVTIRITEDDDGARLTLEHETTEDFPSDFWTTYGPGATGVGWDLAFLGLATACTLIVTNLPVLVGGSQTVAVLLALSAPRLRASMPICPVPPNKSSTFEPGISK